VSTPGGRIETAFVPPSVARATAIPCRGVAETSAHTSSARSSGRSAETTAAIGSATMASIAARSASFHGNPLSSNRATPSSSSDSAETTVTGPTAAVRTAASTAASISCINEERSSGERTAARRLFAESSRFTGTST
jgi:hypothetical protein